MITRRKLATLLASVGLGLTATPTTAQAQTTVPQIKAFGSYSKINSQVTWSALFNVAKIEEQGTGTVQVRFQRPMATNKYVVVVSAENTPVAWAWNKQPDSFWISTGMDRTVDFVVYGQ